MKLRIPILTLAAAALLSVSAAPALAHCECRQRSHRTAHVRSHRTAHVRSVDYAYVSAPRASAYVPAPRAVAWIKTDIEPDEARVYLDGRYIGTADDYDGWPRKLCVAAGTHRLTFRLRGYAPYSVVIHAAPGRVVDLDYWLKS